MSLSGDVNISVIDNGGGTVIVPSSSLQVVIGCCSSGTAAQVVATRSLSTLTSTFGYGPLVEAAGLAIIGGGTVLAMKAATNTAGAINTTAAKTITDASNATPIVITTSTAHGYSDGWVVTVTGVTGNTGANGTFAVNVLTSDTFELIGSAGTGAWVSGGTSTFTGSIQSGSMLTTSGVSTVYFSGTPYDTYYAELTVTRAGTVGTAPGPVFTLSLDAGRNDGPAIALGTATTYSVTNTGLTINFTTAKTLAVGDTVRVATTAPTWSTSGVSACMTALLASPYATGGWGSMHLVGTCSGADATTIGGYVDTLAAGYVFSRLQIDSRDAAIPTGWGGAGETEATWMAAILADFASVSQRRVLAGAGYYNMPSAFDVPAAGTPAYRRSLTWAQAARTVGIPPQQHSGKVAAGSLSQIVVDPSVDPSDGFIYHDERVNPGLDILTGGSGRFTSARTRLGYGSAFFIVNPLLLSPLGSAFTILPLGNVMDIACGIVHQTGQLFINSDVRTNPNGTIYENDARFIENTIYLAIKDQQIATNEISGAVVSVDRTNNIQTTSNLNITVTISARGYVLQETVSITLGSPNAA